MITESRASASTWAVGRVRETSNECLGFRATCAHLATIALFRIVLYVARDRNDRVICNISGAPFASPRLASSCYLETYYSPVLQQSFCALEQSKSTLGSQISTDTSIIILQRFRGQDTNRTSVNIFVSKQKKKILFRDFVLRDEHSSDECKRGRAPRDLL